MIGVVIMASGASTRMGKNKLLLEYDGKPLILHTIERILAQDFHDIVIVTCHKEIAEIAKCKGIRCIYNNSANLGQSQSIKLGVENLESLQLLDGYMFFTGDQPLLDDGTINNLIQCFNAHQNNIIVPSFKGRKGNPVIFPKKFRNELLSLTGDTGGRSVLNQNPGDVMRVEIENQYAIWDIDTPEDYKKLIDINKGK